MKQDKYPYRRASLVCLFSADFDPVFVSRRFTEERSIRFMNTKEDAAAIWNMMYEAMKEEKELPVTAITLWFGDCRLESLSADSAVFAADSKMKKNVIETKYLDYLSRHLEAIIGFVPKNVTVTSPEDEDDEIASLDRRFGDEEQKSDASSETEERKGSERKLTFNSDFTFDNFVVGRSNAMAHANAVSVAENPGKLINPLFIYGHSGLGKTHLMYAIANRVLERDSSMNVIYIKGEDFMNQFIISIKTGKTVEFRKKFRGADMLLIDDIQYIASGAGESTQTEFFHTFEALYEDHRQIIITSDRPPQELTILEERIRNRFESGLLADIQPPDLELRLAILQNKAEHHGLSLSPEVLNFLAEKLQSNVRQIEGVIKKLAAKSLLTGQPVTLDLVKTTVPEYIRDTFSINDYVETIISCVARRTHVDPEDILGRKRNKEIKNARNICMYIIRSLTQLSLPKIGSYFERDYSTVHSNLDAVEKQMALDPLLESEINDIINDIKRT